MDFIPSPPVGRIKDVASDVFVVFNENYIRAFGVNLLKKKLDTKAIALPSPYQLLNPPKAKKILKEGLVTKFTKRERWALNYLVLKNEADDYAFYYFAAEADKDDPKKARGRIFLDSYSVREFSEKEKNEYKHQNGLVLEPWYSRRRTWIFKLETPDQTREWKDVITEAIRKSPPPFNPDPVLQKSFMSAYTKAWWHFPGYCGAYPGYGGSEQEHLSGMISDRCENEFMKETYDKIPAGFFHSTLENRVKGILDATIGASVSAGWRAAQEALDKARSPIEKVVDEKLEYVATLRREMEDKVAENIANIIGPYLQRLSGPLIQPLCKIMVEPASMALLGVIQLWNSQMKPPTADRSQELSWNAASWYQMGPIWEGVRSFTRSDALRALDSVLKDFKKDEIETEMQNSTTTLLRKAAYTFQKESEGKTGDLTPVMTSVTQKLEHDARIIALDTIQTVMENIISNPLKKELMPQFSKATAPVEDLIPDAMKQIVDVDSILEKVVDKTISSTIQKVIEPLSKDRIDSIIHV